MRGSLLEPGAPLPNVADRLLAPGVELESKDDDDLLAGQNCPWLGALDAMAWKRGLHLRFRCSKLHKLLTRCPTCSF